MLVDDKQAREKIAKIFDDANVGSSAYLVRNVDLSDCEVDTGDAAHLVAALWVAASSEDIDYLQRLIARSAPMVESLSAQVAALTAENKRICELHKGLMKNADERLDAAEAQVAEHKEDAERMPQRIIAALDKAGIASMVGFGKRTARQIVLDAAKESGP